MLSINLDTLNGVTGVDVLFIGLVPVKGAGGAHAPSEAAAKDEEGDDRKTGWSHAGFSCMPLATRDWRGKLLIQWVRS